MGLTVSMNVHVKMELIATAKMGHAFALRASTEPHAVKVGFEILACFSINDLSPYFFVI